jgi:hypothetical protein
MGAAVVLLGSTTPTLAAVCNNVTFSLINGTDGPIEVRRVGYRDLDSGEPGTRREENVPNFACPSGDTCTTTRQDLGSITRPRENHELTDIQFEHSHLDEFGDWGDPHWGASYVPDTTTTTCIDDHNYGPFEHN